MTKKKEDRKEAHQKRLAGDGRISEKLSATGRFPVERIAYGSVRLVAWVHPNPEVSSVIEFYRTYSVPDHPGVSSLLEASDLFHMSRAMNEMEKYLDSLKRPKLAL